MLGGLFVAAGLMVRWIDSTVFDAESLSQRSVAALDSEAVRHELALQLTDQLARRGNREVLAFRPAALLTMEAIIDTDTFKSIFATAVRRLHADLLAGTAGSGLDLADSLSILSSSLQLSDPIAENPGTSDSAGSFASVIGQIDDLSVWERRSEIELTSLLLLPLGLGCGVLAVVVAADRRRAIGHVGMSLLGVGIGVLAAVLAASKLAETFPRDDDLRAAARDLAWAITADLRATALGLAAIGVVVLAAADSDNAVAPERLGRSLMAAVRRLRASTGGTLVLATAAGLGGLVIIINTAGALRLTALIAGLGLLYCGARLCVTAAARRPPAEVQPAPARHHGTWEVVTGAGLLAVVSIAVVLLTGHAHDRAEATFERQCWGSTARCGLRLDQLTLPGAHNAMSSADYPGWLFAEQLEPIGTQLRAGVRALLIDTHYGIASSVVVPGAEVPLVLTDRAAEITVPDAEAADPAQRRRAEELIADAPPAADAARDVYLCHNYCELGAVRFVDELRTLHHFLDEHPGEVVMLILQDATATDDVVEAFDDAGLLSEVATLRKGRPLPTLGDLVDAGTQLLVFSERGDGAGPAWYHAAFDWFQETSFTYSSPDELDCAPNRGAASNPLLLVNHWVTASPPDPGLARRTNDAQRIEDRVARCRTERGLVANIVAADFVSSGDVLSVTDALTGHR